MRKEASGTEITLTAGKYIARIVTVGAGLAGLTYDSHDIVYPHQASQTPPAYVGKTLLPWPNRITDGVYQWNGQTYRVPVNDFEHNAALHGFMSWVEWQIEKQDLHSVTLTSLIPSREEYPWALQSWVTFTLNARTGLTVDITTYNISIAPAPYGAGTHPYLTIDKKGLNTLEFTMPARTVMDVNENLAPVGQSPVEGTPYDFATRRILGDTAIDHAFTDLPEGTWAVSLRDPESGVTATLESDQPWLQVYTGELIDRTGIAVEPMTCPPDAFNADPKYSLDSEQQHTMSFRIYAHRD